MESSTGATDYASKLVVASMGLAQLTEISPELGNIPWGQDFSLGKGSGFCKAAWDAYYAPVLV